VQCGLGALPTARAHQRRRHRQARPRAPRSASPTSDRLQPRRRQHRRPDLRRRSCVNPLTLVRMMIAASRAMIRTLFKTRSVYGCFAFLKGLVGNCRAFVGKLPALSVFAHETHPLTGCLLTGLLTAIVARLIASPTKYTLRGAILRLF